VLLHACCHNPTGVDLSPAQWDALIPVLRARQLLPYLDLAYQGYGDGIDEDAYAVRRLAASGLTFFVANSFSKSMSVYGERCGALSVVCATAPRPSWCWASCKLHRAAQLFQPAIHAARSSPRAGDAALRTLGSAEPARRGRDARAHRRDAA
jgi:aromatic-amino-acid transaminase